MKKEEKIVIALAVVVAIVLGSIVVAVYNKPETSDVNAYSYNKIRSISKGSDHKIIVKTSVPADLAAYWGGYRHVKSITIKYQKASALYPWIADYHIITKTINDPSAYCSRYKYGPWFNRRSYLKYQITLPSDVYKLNYVKMTVSNNVGGTLTMSKSCDITFR